MRGGDGAIGHRQACGEDRDVLFAGSIGRTAFPGSDHEALIRNICENLLTLPDPTVAYSGENDKQKQAADLMAEALKKEGIELILVLRKEFQFFHDTFGN